MSQSSNWNATAPIRTLSRAFSDSLRPGRKKINNNKSNFCISFVDLNKVVMRIYKIYRNMTSALWQINAAASVTIFVTSRWRRNARRRRFQAVLTRVANVNQLAIDTICVRADISAAIVINENIFIARSSCCCNHRLFIGNTKSCWMTDALANHKRNGLQTHLLSRVIVNIRQRTPFCH